MTNSSVRIEKERKGQDPKGPRVLLIDDETELVDSLKENLQLHGYQVCIALDGVTALVKAKQEKPDLILLDLTLPQLDGRLVLKQLKADERCQNIPILVMTAQQDVRDLTATLENGAVSCYVKPVDFGTLLNLIQSLLSGAGK